MVVATRCHLHRNDLDYTPPRHEVLPIAMGARPEDYERQAPYKSYIHVDQFAGDQTNTNIEMEHA